MSLISTSGIVYIRQIGSNIQSSLNGTDWQTLSSFPVTIINTDTSTRLKVLFTNEITITSVNQYFVCGSENIQFGSESLNTDGNRYSIVVNVNNYPGFIQNGTNSISSNPYSNIFIYNLFVDGTGYQTDTDGGWVGQELFGSETVCYIVNCASAGDIAQNGGGIVGQGSGGLIGGSLTIIGCSSTGTIGQWGGGIAGTGAGGSLGSITCEGCWSEGNIGQEAGGILGSYSGNNGSATVTKCYSLGTIGQGGGGIYGYYAAEVGQAIAEKCYSRGLIQTDAGGIFGSYATYVSPPATGGTANAINCYSLGSIATSGNGIYGTQRGTGASTANCYSANGSWSSVLANSSLFGFPSSTLGTTWVAATVAAPYELNGIGYTPYSIAVIDASTSQLIQTYRQTITAGGISDATLFADASGNAVRILGTSGGNASSYNTITINTQTGIVTTTAATGAGTYTLTLRSTGSYNYTTFLLTVLPAPVPDPNRTTEIKFPDNETYIELKVGNTILQERNTNPTFKFYSYEQYARWKAAQVTHS